MSIASSPDRFLDRHFRVSKRYPCPVCGKPDYCVVSRDGKYALCQRVPSDRPSGKAGYYHKLYGSQPRVNTDLPRIKPTDPRAAPEIINNAYTSLLKILTLSPPHLNNLLSRGLTHGQIQALMYKTLPARNRDWIIRDLMHAGVVLDGVPGFWRKAGYMGYESTQWQLAGQAGILVPVRDRQRKIAGIQIRCDNSSHGKYQWLSSVSKPYGTSSGAHIHIAIPSQTDPSEIWITEGSIKADIAALKLNRVVLAVPGVGSYAGVFPIIQELKPQRVIIALDMDKSANPMVKECETHLIIRLLNLKIRTFRADWNSQFKGLDDFLARGL